MKSNINKIKFIENPEIPNFDESYIKVYFNSFHKLDSFNF